MVRLLIVLDFDGTLLADRANKTSQFTRQRLERVASAGIPIVGATGRSRPAAQLPLEGLDVVERVIGSNGAECYERFTGRPPQQWPVDLADVRRLHELVDPALPGVGWAYDTPGGVIVDDVFSVVGEAWRLDEVKKAHLLLDPQPGVPIDERLWALGPVLRVLALHPTHPRRLFQCLRRAAPHQVTRSGARFFEVNARGVDKASALTWLCQDLGVPLDHVIAFGDHLNDLTILQAAGRGIAMVNGHVRLRRAIGELSVASNNEDGVVRTLELLLPDVFGRRSGR